MLETWRSSHLVVLLIMACHPDHGKGTTPHATSEPPAQAPPSDPDSLLAGTYHLTLTGVPHASPEGSLVGTLVLSATDIPTRVRYLGADPVRGCLFLDGDLSLLGPETTPSRGSIATFVGLDTTGNGWLSISVYRGVDYGYNLNLAIRQGRLEGTGAGA